ncbi:methylated-DNA--[protein]-cysteine S-methyltransferase [Nostocoides sp. F2B08]|uniref:methylated-DNA--[protein]-cysteine S-methyltransferase n=1 Tax=Nostocoides sp. F2B08 TaxID=2653936 RepID=UPI00126308FC|nr:methylated-DNA--[protein]-cysteine S-methyltransferase [Tetrasphaera sp. F2B08]KAB7744634.1 methylated-DNA--[protein]-cysteine S-methyltransferase [Tetrasphaera sp. F2B08]
MSVPSTPSGSDPEAGPNSPFVSDAHGPLRHAAAPTALGVFTLVADDVAVTAVHYPGQDPPLDGAWGTPVRAEDHPVLGPAATQLAEYVDGARTEFALPLRPAGTAFQRDVWAALLAIPYGVTRSYREQAESLGRPNAVRAVGAANGRNPIPVVIPCHRVIGSGGALTGYAGGTTLKRALLDLESGSRPLPTG